jgi:hypothetical protein
MTEPEISSTAAADRNGTFIDQHSFQRDPRSGKSPEFHQYAAIERRQISRQHRLLNHSRETSVIVSLPAG